MQAKQHFSTDTGSAATSTSIEAHKPGRSDRSQDRSEPQPHVLVVGAGLGGLSTAIHLAREGWRVTVLEKNARCGGRMNVIEEEGFRIDMGPTLLMMPEVIQGIFLNPLARSQNRVENMSNLRCSWRIWEVAGMAPPPIGGSKALPLLQGQEEEQAGPIANHLLTVPRSQ